MRTLLAGVLAIALTTAIVSPALGGPSITSVGKTAKNALSTGKSAQRSARSASRKATAAQSAADTANSRIGPIGALATTANGKADQALARPTLTAGQISEVVGVKDFYEPGEIGSSIAFCPAGSRAISGGGAAITGVADGIAISDAETGRTAWFVIAGNNASTTGEIQAFAYCAPTGSAVAATTSRSAIRREVARLADKLADAR